ncbi:MAG TPA: hypothetical protein VMT42_00145 [candidate division Zixibacteria bacterium]|nr:hypothetical protein [candidate division Zixibacteria bacterium]
MRNTTGVPFGNYTLIGVVDSVAGEIYTTNNNYADGQLWYRFQVT